MFYTNWNKKCAIFKNHSKVKGYTLASLKIWEVSKWINDLIEAITKLQRSETVIKIVERFNSKSDPDVLNY